MTGKTDSTAEPAPAKTKMEVCERERAKLAALFADRDESLRNLVDGLIDDAAFLFAENWELAELLKTTGMVRVHPTRPELQKPVPAAAQYRANEKAYANIIGKLAMILQRDRGGDEDDDFDEFNEQYD